VVNSATFGPATASATWTTIVGANLSQTTRQWTGSDFNGNLLPTSLSGVSVLVDGIPAYVAYVSPTQINVLLPDDSTTGTVSVQVMNSAGSASSTLQKQTFAPGFFTLANNYVAAVHADGTLIGPVGLYPTSTPAHPGEEILLFGTGFGPTNPPTPTGQLVSQPAPAANPIVVSVGGVQVTPLFAGITESGVYQFNVTVPNVANGDEPVIATVGGQSTQSPLNINVQQ
jgi:uncharacterized protein (TIGR03437 family)